MTSTDTPLLVTFPGKLGDLIYSLPAVMAIKDHYKRPVVYRTSPYCRQAIPLLKQQPYLADGLVDEDYHLEHTRYGCQPYVMTAPSGFTQIFHLGFRQELLGASVLTRPLVETFFYTLENVYGLRLPRNYQNPYLFLPEVTKGEYLVFQGFGDTLNDLMDQAGRDRLSRFWRELFSRLKREVIIVTGPKERPLYAGLPGRIVTPGDLLETARTIKGAKGFIGGQSVAAAIADGLKIPRLIHGWFANAYPQGPGGLSFTLPVDVDEVAVGLQTRFGW